ncbi:MAG: hypothetical protein AAGF30_10305 [Pseudomonadota bacterium]
MDGKQELDARIARLEAALEATGSALTQAKVALAASAKKVQQLEADVAARDAALTSGKGNDAPAADSGEEANRLRAAVEALTATSADLRAKSDGAPDRALQAELEALRAARALDLAEMESILAELDPLLSSGEETTHA